MTLLDVKGWKLHGKNILLIIGGALIFAFGISYFAMANGLAEGGITGIAILANYQFGFSPGIVYLVLNIPLLIIGYRMLGRQTLIYTLIGLAAVSGWLTVTEWFTEKWGEPIEGDPLLAALYTGVFVGVGLGLIFRSGGTTGGADIIARLCNKYFDWSIGKTIFIFDLAVIGLSVPFIGREKAMYTLVAVFIGSQVIDFVIEGIHAAKAATIISNSAVSISERITKEMERGVTLIKGRGGYTGIDKEVLYVIVSRNEVPRLKQLVNSVDPQAFVVVHDVRDVFGEGFSRMNE